jgi:hypothetical protein
MMPLFGGCGVVSNGGEGSLYRLGRFKADELGAARLSNTAGGAGRAAEKGRHIEISVLRNLQG